MEVNFRQNVCVGPELVSALHERLRYKSFLKNSSGTNDIVRLREVSALEDVRFREVSLYNNFFNNKLSYWAKFSRTGQGRRNGF